MRLTPICCRTASRARTARQLAGFQPLLSSVPPRGSALTRLAALPDHARVYSGHDYVIANGKFALAADPDNAALKTRIAEAEKANAEGRFLIPSTLCEEKATNPFLRVGSPALARPVKMEGAKPVAVFQALREWKNRF
jgi:hydroxyacylglutathione hydrolase